MYKNYDNQQIKAILRQIRAKWRKNLFSTDTHHKQAEKSVDEVYQKSGLKSCPDKLWFNSPFEGYLASFILLEKSISLTAICDIVVNDNHALQNVKSWLDLQLGDGLHRPKPGKILTGLAYHESWEEEFENFFSNHFSESIIDEIWSRLDFDEEYENVIRPVTTFLDEEFESAIGCHIKDLVHNANIRRKFAIKHDPEDLYYDMIDKMDNYGFGVFDTETLAKYDFCLAMGHTPNLKKLNPLMELANYCGFWWPFQHAVILTDKPKYISVDQRGSLHAIGRKALEYPDGWGLWMVHGAEMPEKWASKSQEHWDCKWLFKTDNAEQRRAIIQVLGYDRIMIELKSKLIHSDLDMELRRIDNVDLEPIALLKVVCPSTGHEFVLRVPPNIDTCEKARKWTMWDEQNQKQFMMET